MATGYGNHYLDTFGVNARIVEEILGNLQNAAIDYDVAGPDSYTYNWDKTEKRGKEYGATPTLDQRGRVELLTIQKSYHYVLDWLLDPENNVPTRIQKIWQNPQIPLYRKTQAVMAIVQPLTTKEVVSRGALSENLAGYDLAKSTGRPINQQLDPYRDQVRDRIKAHNAEVRDPFRAFMKDPTNARLISRLFPATLMRKYGDPSAVSAELQDYLIDHLDSHTEASRAHADLNITGRELYHQAEWNVVRSIEQDAKLSGNAKLASWALLMNDPSNQKALVSLEQNLMSQWEAQGHSAKELQEKNNQLASLLYAVQPTKNELQDSLSQTLTKFTGKDTAQVISRAILSETIKQGVGSHSFDTNQIITRALQRAGIDDSPELVAMLAQEYGGDIRFQISDLRGHNADNPKGESLTRQGIDPRDAVNNVKYWDQLTNDLGITNFRAGTPLALQNKQETVDQIRQQLATELASMHPNQARIRNLRSLEDYLRQRGETLSPLRELQVRGMNTLGQVRSNFENTTTGIYEIYEKYTGQKLIAKAFDQWHEFTETFTVPISFGAKTYEIPLFNLSRWAFEWWINQKKSFVHNQLIMLRGKSGAYNTAKRWFFRNYAKGGYELNGLWGSAIRERWSTTLKWATQTITAGKYTTFNSLKIAIRQGIANRLIAWGTQLAAKQATSALGRWLIELGAGIGDGGLTLPLVLIDILITIGFEALKWAWNNKGKLAAGLGIGAGVISLGLGSLMNGTFGALSSALNGIAGMMQGLISGLGTALSTLPAIFATSGIILGSASGVMMFLQKGSDFVARLTPREGDSHESFQCKNAPATPPDVSGRVVFGSRNGTTYAFPVVDQTGYSCYHWDGALAVDIFTGQANFDDPEKNLPVVAYVSGTIEMTVDDDDLGGRYLILAGDDGRYYYYAHNCALYVKDGERVVAGQPIAITDQTGKNAKITPEHSHFAIANSPNFYDGGTVCAQSEFETTFHMGKCLGYDVCMKPANP